MNKNHFFLTLSIFMFSCSAYTQALNDYKYIMIPTQFSFQREAHQFNLNRLTKFLFEKYEFDAIIQGEDVPKDLNGCDALVANVYKGKGFLKTTLNIELKDCKGQVVFRSIDGVSREKDFKKSYHEAIRRAFKDPKLLGHHYINKMTAASVATTTTPVTNKAIPTSNSKVNLDPTVSVSISKPEYAEAKKKLDLNSKDLQLELRGKEYLFKALQNDRYDIYQNGIKLGTAVKLENSKKYKLSAGILSGTGYFDDFGNFVLERINPANKKTITDTMARLN